MPDDKTIDFVVAFVSIGMLVLGLGSVALGWIVRTYDRVMSRWTAREETIAPSSLETDAGRTPDGRAPDGRTPDVIEAKQLLTLYTLMRAYGIKRDEAQAACTASGLPFNNNVWASAKPADPPHLTPVANRPTDADFPYQAL